MINMADSNDDDQRPRYTTAAAVALAVGARTSDIQTLRHGVSLSAWYPLLLQASSQGPPVSAVVYSAACRWAQHRLSGAVVTV